MNSEEDDLRRAIHDTCQAIFMAYERRASPASIQELRGVLERLDRRAAVMGLGFDPLPPPDPWKPK
jgi:hypothetical protein